MCVILTDKNFDAEVLESREPVMVVFSADWCGPCHMVAPMIDDLASEFKGRVKMGKSDVDMNASIAARYGVRSTPTFLFFRKGQLVDQVVGVVPKRVLADRLNTLL